MNKTHSPGPWKLEGELLRDANNRMIVGGDNEGYLWFANPVDAELILAATEILELLREFFVEYDRAIGDLDLRGLCDDLAPRVAALLARLPDKP